MAYKKGQTTLAADIPDTVFEAFDDQRLERGQVKKEAVSAAIRLWVSLPDELQGRLLNKTLSETYFVELIHEIVEERIQAGEKTGKALVEHHKHKQARKD